MFARNYCETNNIKFKTTLKNTVWSDLYSIDDCNEAYNVFIDKFYKIYNDCFSFKKLNKKSVTSLKKPWISGALLKSIKRKNNFYKDNSYQ